MKRRLLVLALLAALLALPSSAQAAFSVSAFSVAAEKNGGGAETQAGGHPYAFSADLAFDTEGGARPPRQMTLHLPPGFLVNPTAVSECSAAAFGTPRGDTSFETPSASGESCPNSTQIGTIGVRAGGSTRYFGLFNLMPAFGDVAAFGASPFGTPLVFEVRLREGDAGLDVVLEGVSQAFALEGLEMTVWGTPWQQSHDGQRGNCLNEQNGGSWGSCLVYGGAAAPESLIRSYLTLPTTPCGPPPSFALSAGSWQGDNAAAEASIHALTACNTDLTVAKVQLMTAKAAARTGLAFNLEVNDGGGILNPAGIARPAIKEAIVSLPEGLTLNPSLAAGLGVCSEADFAREAAGSEPGAGCPNGSKIGEVTVEGTLGLAEPLHGSMYLATPHANPFGTLIAVYMLARLPRRGLIVKSVGKLEPDPHSGRLVATFDELPRLLYTHFSLTLREGQRSALISPPTCGAYPSDLQLSSWAAPANFRSESSTFFIQQGEDGGPCPTGGIPPFAPGLLAGSINPGAGAYTPFYLRMTRGDSEQEITSYSASFPPGLLADISGVSECPDPAIAAAGGRSGSEEQANPSCPASSSIGHTIAGYGVGGTLAWAPGGLYLAGPYHGAPLSVVAIDAALVGPFDLGTVVVRQAVRIDPRTAQVSLDAIGSDPIPHILDGIPLHLRDIRVYVDRPHFMVNPTSCDPMQVASTLGGAGADPFSLADDTVATSTERYQLLGCRALGFRPNLSLRLLGSTRHGGFPSLRAVYRPRPGDANLDAVSVTLPPSLFLEQAHIDEVCTRPRFAAQTCPAGSVYGRARAVVPLLDEPLEGPVYLRSSDHAVPDLVADLRGRGIEIEVPGRIDSTHGRMRANFESLPDAPVTSFTMTLFGGKRGLLANAEIPCRGVHRALARFVGHNSATAVLHPSLQAKCGHRRRKRK